MPAEKESSGLWTSILDRSWQLPKSQAMHGNGCKGTVRPTGSDLSADTSPCGWRLLRGTVESPPSSDHCRCRRWNPALDRDISRCAEFRRL
ncbi:hypothetical protein MRB53_024675 [Persea americana]|uniref:Uncharacterized protein n=1 Tax=Persea americana TaxID=3435 RepID=A0ACC2LE08_PERAE|nr:hypothetical protein MRB53_024675 [Persea americana]